MFVEIVLSIFAFAIILLYMVCVIAEHKEYKNQKKIIEEMQKRLTNAETWNELNHSLIRNYVEIFQKKIKELQNETKN